jgi:hypothetical protein
MNEDQYTEIKRELRNIKRGSNIQTVALVMLFVFGISSIADLITKLKK